MFNPLKIDLRTSHIWYRFVVIVHLLAVVAVVITPVEPFVKGVFILLLVASGFSFFRFPINQGVAQILWNSDQHIFATLGGDGVQTVHREPRSVIVLPFLICIKLDASAPVANQWLILLPDMMPAESWRRLQVLARLSELDA